MDGLLLLELSFTTAVLNSAKAHIPDTQKR